MAYEDLAQQIADVVQEAAPLARVWPYYILGAEPSDWPAAMRSQADGGRVHGWCITRRSLTSEEQMGGHALQRPGFLLTGVHYHYTGTAADNSEWKFQDEIDAINAGFAASTTLVVLGGVIWDVITIIQTGAELVHWASAQLTLEIC